MAVTTVSIRLALKKIAEITCGMSPRVIPVTALGDPVHRVFAVSIPFEYKAEVCLYLTAHLGLPHAVDGGPLLLTAQQASAVVELAFSRGVSRSAA
jgi:hypothetical protein